MHRLEFILLLADIHANYLALRAVVADARTRYPPPQELETWFLGDIFGRGPEPIKTWEQLEVYKPKYCVIGNHDLGLIGKYINIHTDEIKDGTFNSDDWSVILKQRQKLKDGLLLGETQGNSEFHGEVFESLQRWPLAASPRQGIYLVHGGMERSLNAVRQEAKQARHPLMHQLENHFVWDYVKEQKHAAWTLKTMRWLVEHPIERDALKTVGAFAKPPHVVVVGHFHRRTLYCQGLYAEGTRDTRYDWLRPVKLDQPYSLKPSITRPILISPGSVGFPREDHDRDASYAVLCLRDGRIESVTFHAAPFDREYVQKQMRVHGYPQQIVNYLNLPS